MLKSTLDAAGCLRCLGCLLTPPMTLDPAGCFGCLSMLKMTLDAARCLGCLPMLKMTLDVYAAGCLGCF